MADLHKKPLHVVILPLSASGHMIPALLLAHRLATLGFYVTYVCPQHRLANVRKEAIARQCHERIKMLGLKQLKVPEDILQECSSGHDSQRLITWVIDHSDEDKQEFIDIMKKLMLQVEADDDEDDDDGYNQWSPPACIISDNMRSWSQDVANEFGIPRFSIYPSPCEVLALAFHVKTLHQEGRLPIRTTLGSSENWQEEPVHIPGMFSIYPNDIMGALQDISPKNIHQFYIRHSVRVHECAGILCNSMEEFEPKAFHALQNNHELNPNMVPTLAVGPLLPDSFFKECRDITEKSREEEECLQWLNKQPVSSVVYISFGSFLTPSAAQIYELALGLAASKQRFLWVLRPHVLDILPQGFISETEHFGFLMQNWAPQLMVLSNPSIASFITHCGWNSTLESISLGVPILAMPLFADQITVAKIVVDQLKVGLRLTKNVGDVVKSEEIERIVKAMVDGTEGVLVRERARQLRTAALLSRDETNNNLRKFLEDKISLSLREWNMLS